MNSLRQRPPTPWPLLILFAVISAGAIFIGKFYYHTQEKRAFESNQQELSSVADLKVGQILQWRRERLSDGNYLSQNISFNRRLSDFISDSNNKKLRYLLLNHLKTLIDNYDYRSAVFVDKYGRVKLYYPDQDTVIEDYLKPRLFRIIRNENVQLTDFQQTENVSFVHLDLLVPIRSVNNNDTTITGLLILRIDPQEVLYPLIQSWPVTSKSSETLLFHREGDEIIYLNELRHQENTNLVLRLPVARDKLVAALALQGISETTDAVDYRGKPVIAAMKKIPDSPWYMVAKVDRDEILVKLKGQVSLVLIIVILFILALGALLGFLWWNQRVRFYREKYEAELDRLALIRHYDYILKYANDIIFLLDKDYVIIEINDKALETLQYRREELIGQTIKVLLPSDVIEGLNNDLRVLNEVGYSTFETEQIRKDGSVLPIEVSARMVDIEGIKYYQAICRDITERRRSEETLRESEERFRKIFEESPFCMVMSGKDMCFIRANSAFCNMIGYTEDELMGLTFKSFTHPNYIGNDEVSLLRLVAGDIPVYHTEKRYIRKDGKIIWGSTTVSIIRNSNGEVQLFLVMVEDITSRRIAEEELEKSISLMKATLESTADGILVVDSEGKIVQYNKKFAEMWRIPEEILNTMQDEAALQYVLVQLKYPDDFIDKVKHLYSDNEAITEDFLEFKDGRFFERYSQPQKIGGNTAGRVWSFRDITARKNVETALIAAKEKAEESDRLKTAFLHNVSHEIRTPMNAILGFSTLLSEPGLSKTDRNQFTEIIFQSGNQLLSIINDIVDLATIETGQVKVNLKEINLHTALKELSGQFSYKEKASKINLSLKTHLKEVTIVTDNTKLVQIFSNLINNAFKFTQKGKISFGYDLKDDYVEFFVIDTGIGIPPEHQSRIFDRFYQVDNAISRQYTGTGLGLSICKAYVELLGGKIWLVSSPGKGTEFYFTLPYRVPGEV
jgi:PAS domain S-box-containing protein